MAFFCILYKLCAMFLRTNAKFEPGLVKRNFYMSIWAVWTTCTIYLLLDIMKEKKTIMIDREYSKTTKNHKLITKHIRKAHYLDERHFVLKLYGDLSVIFMNLCTKKKETMTKMCYDILSEKKCTQIVAVRLSFDFLTQSSTCSFLYIYRWNMK